MLQHTELPTAFCNAAFSSNNEDVLLYSKRASELGLIVRRRVSDGSLVQSYDLEAAIFGVVAAPAADCFAVRTEKHVSIFSGIELDAVMSRDLYGGDSDMAFSYDGPDRHQLLLAVASHPGDTSIFELGGGTRYDIPEIDDPVACAFSPDGTSLVVLHDWRMSILRVDHLREEMKRAKGDLRGFIGVSRVQSISPPRRIVNTRASGMGCIPDMPSILHPSGISFSADSSRVLVRHDHHALAVWRMSDATKIAQEEVSRCRKTEAAFVRANGDSISSWCVSDSAKDVEKDAVHVEDAAFLDKQGRFVAAVSNHKGELSVVVWDTKLNTVAKTVFGKIFVHELVTDKNIAHVNFAMSRIGGLFFSGYFTQRYYSCEPDAGVNKSPTVTKIDYAPAADFDPDAEFADIKSAAKLS